MMMVAMEEVVVWGVEFIGSDHAEGHRGGVNFGFSRVVQKHKHENVPYLAPGTITRYLVPGSGSLC